ncbi:hypothetical protein ZIOFF_006168 [Zingiber officinale]|uniref:Uncharacterized protein n=1 Tax=Zingiber officinale TaxID=94328 RepID=A0A8J5HRU5_ZINOF|nr:hypothetical protein ZIOFF_006168 [Zingiber officinale]
MYIDYAIIKDEPLVVTETNTSFSIDLVAIDAQFKFLDKVRRIGYGRDGNCELDYAVKRTSWTSIREKNAY